MNRAAKISCYIRTLNEERKIGEVINAAFQVADEVVLIDSGSTDKTIEIAKQSGARVIHQDWLGNGHQKRVGEEACRNNWLLDLDADEIVSKKLADQINALFKNGEPAQNVYKLPMAIVTPHGEIWNTAVQSKRAKIYDKRALRMPAHKAWDQLAITSDIKVGLLTGELFHYAFADLGHLLQKQNSWSTIGAKEGRLKPYWSLVLRILFGLPIYFLKHYFQRRLWKYGLYGFSYSLIIAFGRWLRDVKMMERYKMPVSL